MTRRVVTTVVGSAMPRQPTPKIAKQQQLDGRLPYTVGLHGARWHRHGLASHGLAIHPCHGNVKAERELCVADAGGNVPWID